MATTEVDDFFAGFTTHAIQRPKPRPLPEVGDKVRILHLAGAGSLGTVSKTGIKMSWSDQCMIVERDDGSGAGIYAPSDVRLMRDRDVRR
jgi:hypothetical protein